MNEEGSSAPAGEWQLVLRVRSEDARSDGRTPPSPLLPTQWQQLTERVVVELQREFGPRLKVVWEIDDSDPPPRPEFLLDGEPLRRWHPLAQGYLAWALLRLEIATRLLARESLESLLAEADADLARLRLSSASWQDGLLEWSLARGREGGD
jgi:hypothetical protein